MEEMEGLKSEFQSPLGEVVKKTQNREAFEQSCINVSIPSRGSGKGDSMPETGTR